MNNLIDRYIYDVINKLPDTQREDVGKELKATIEDMVASRVENGESEEVATNSVLVELGNPFLLAPKYNSAKQYLIGPRYFPIYKMSLSYVLKYALPAIGIILFIIRLFENQQGIFQLLLGLTFAVINIATMIIFWVSVIFILIEHYDAEIPELNTEWKPEMLPQLPPKRQISRTDGWMEIVGAVVSIIFSIYAVNGFDALNLDVWRPIWAGLLFVQIAELIHNLFAFKIGNWTRLITISNTVISSALVALGIIILETQNLVKPEYINKLIEGGLANAPQVVTWVVNIGAGSIIFICFIQIVDGIRKHLHYRENQS